MRDTGNNTRQYQQIVVDYTAVPSQVVFISGVQHCSQAIVLDAARVAPSTILFPLSTTHANLYVNMIAFVQQSPTRMILAGKDGTPDPTDTYSKSNHPQVAASGTMRHLVVLQCNPGRQYNKS